MCYFLFAASPITLSEVRSMLPPGFSADLVGPADHAALRTLFPESRTGVRLLLGACSCDLVIARSDARQEERHLRSRHLDTGRSRGEVIAALESHRRRGAGFGSVREARAALAGFVAEHARNAGPTLYLLCFGSAPLDRRAPLAPAGRLARRDVAANVDGWLIEDRPTIVVP
jgi:hypothetical protein